MSHSNPINSTRGDLRAVARKERTPTSLGLIAFAFAGSFVLMGLVDSMVEGRGISFLETPARTTGLSTAQNPPDGATDVSVRRDDNKCMPTDGA